MAAPSSLCVAALFICGGQVAQGSYYSLALWWLEQAGDSGGERGIGQQRNEKDAVRYVKDSRSIYLVILRGDLTGRGS